MKNYNCFFRILFVLCALTLYVFSNSPVTAATFSIGSMNITSGIYTVWDSSGALIINPDTGNTVSSFTTFGPNTNLVSGYIGNGGTGVPATTPDPDSIASAPWFGLVFNTYTAASNLGDDVTPAGTISGGPIPSGVLDNINNTIAMDLSSFFGNWGDVDIDFGTGKNDGITSALATGTWNPVTGAYSMTWMSTVANTVGGPCLPTNCVAQFTFEGTASHVPIPAAIWLFGSGLLGLLGVARRRKAA